jgi:pimeloyl-ACP methyl ester carboxylesterase
MDALREVNPTQLVIYGVSMGGMVSAEFLQHYEDDGAPFGKVSLILDTSPAAMADVKRPAWLARAACWYRGGPVATAGWATALSFMADPAEAGGDRRLIDKAHRAGAWAGTAALATQGCFISRFELRPQLEKAVSRAFYLSAVPAKDDPLVDTRTAVERWKSALPTLVETPVPGRQSRWHIPLVERPEETVSVILAVLE